LVFLSHNSYQFEESFFLGELEIGHVEIFQHHLLEG
jgi:hypothetical protein